MSTGMINVLAVVDVESVLAGGNRWYLVDNDTGSQNEGGKNLTTVCNAGDMLYFRVDPISEGQAVSITSVGPGPDGSYVFGFNQPVNRGGGLWTWQTQNTGAGGYALGVLVGNTNAMTVTGQVTVQPQPQPQLEVAQKAQDASSGAFQLIDIIVAVNTEAIIAGLGFPSSVFMMDNSAASTGQGTDELHTVCNAGDTLQWHCVAINGVDTITITGIEQSSATTAFGSNSPRQIGDEWAWTTANPGSNETYQMRILVNGQYSGSWDPFITVK